VVRGVDEGRVVRAALRLEDEGEPTVSLTPDAGEDTRPPPGLFERFRAVVRSALERAA
jgi:hypothetical protein